MLLRSLENGVSCILPSYKKPTKHVNIINWMSSINQQLVHQENWWWTCRARRFFLQILYQLDDIFYDYDHTMPLKKSPTELAICYIHNNYSKSITLSQLCDVANTNRTYLNKYFKEKTGLSPINYLTSYRLGIAKQLLTHTNLSLSEIAIATGYKYESHFSNIFYSKEGIRPGTYREKNHISRSVFF